MRRVVGYVYEETDYDEFEYLGGNRDITHAKKLLESITEHGFHNVPILVNENNEIIDGQGRFEALKILNLPVRYVVEKGADLEACRVLNMQQTNWGPLDYIKSYADDGNENYQRLYQLIHESNLSASRVIKIVDIDKSRSGKRITERIRSGAFSIGEAEFENALAKLNYIKKFKGFIGKSNAKGNKGFILEVLSFCYDSPSIDNERLLEKFESFGDSYLKGIVTISDALVQVGNIYNAMIRSKEKKVDIVALYEMAKNH